MLSEKQNDEICDLLNAVRWQMDTTEKIAATDRFLAEKDFFRKDFKKQRKRLFELIISGEAEKMNARTFEETRNLYLPIELQYNSLERDFDKKSAHSLSSPLSTFSYIIRFLMWGHDFFQLYLRLCFKLDQDGRFRKPPKNQFERVLRTVMMENYCRALARLFTCAKIINYLNSRQFPSLESLLTEFCTLFNYALTEERLQVKYTELYDLPEDSPARETVLAQFSSWAETRLSPRANKRLRKAIDREGWKSIKEQIPGAVLIALNEKEPLQTYSSVKGKKQPRKKTVLSSVAAKLAVKYSDTKTDYLDECKITPDQITKDFYLKEEAQIAERIDSQNIIDRAKLTLDQKKIWLMMELEEKTAKEVSKELGKALGTITKQKQRADKKLKNVSS